MLGATSPRGARKSSLPSPCPKKNPAAVPESRGLVGAGADKRANPTAPRESAYVKTSAVRSSRVRASQTTATGRRSRAAGGSIDRIAATFLTKRHLVALVVRRLGGTLWVQVVASRDSKRELWCPLMPCLSRHCLFIAPSGPHHHHHHRLPEARLASLIESVPPAPGLPCAACFPCIDRRLPSTAPGVPCMACFPSADRRLSSHGVSWAIRQVSYELFQLNDIHLDEVIHETGFVIFRLFGSREGGLHSHARVLACS